METKVLGGIVFDRIVVRFRLSHLEEIRKQENEVDLFRMIDIQFLSVHHEKRFNTNKFYTFALLYLDIPAIYRNSRKIHPFGVAISSRIRCRAKRPPRKNGRETFCLLSTSSSDLLRSLDEVVCTRIRPDNRPVGIGRRFPLRGTNASAESTISVRNWERLRWP